MKAWCNYSRNVYRFKTFLPQNSFKCFASMMLAIILLFDLLAVNTAVAAEAKAPVEIKFDDGKTQGFVGFGCDVSVTAGQAHSNKFSLFVSKRTAEWGGPRLRVDKLIQKDTVYEVSVWVLSKKADVSCFVLDAMYSSEGVNQQYPLCVKLTKKTDGWTKINGWLFIDSKTSYSDFSIKITNYILDSGSIDNEWYIDDISFRPTGGGSAIETCARLPSLREIYKDHFNVGVTTTYMNNEPYLSFSKRHFNAVTAGYMYPEQLAPKKGVYNFKFTDQHLKFLFDEGITTIHGHPLLWYAVTPDWMNKKSDGSPLTRAEALRNMTDYINTVVKHFAGKVYSWDVLNEGISYDLVSGEMTAPIDWRDAMRDTPWYRAFSNGAKEGESGADYVEIAFRLARKADPNAKLYYNDYYLDIQNKATVVAAMIKDINDRWLAEGNTRLLIEGIGMQSHLYFDTDPADIERSIQRFVDLGLEIHISELDVNMTGWHDYEPWYLSNDGPPTEMLKKQAEIYAKAFQIYKKYSKNISRVTLWGISDDDPKYGKAFNADFTPKLAYFAIADPDGYLAGKYDTVEQRNAWIEKNNRPKGSVKVGSFTLKLRQFPKSSSKEITTIKNGATVDYFEKSGAWIRVRTKDGTEGWAAASYLCSSPYVMKNGDSAKVFSGTLKLRKVSSSSSEVLKTLKYGNVVKILDNTSNKVWVKVDAGGTIGWVAASYVGKGI